MKKVLCIALCALTLLGCETRSPGRFPEQTRSEVSKTESTNTWVVWLTGSLASTVAPEIPKAIRINN